jgi:hypothetical protein
MRDEIARDEGEEIGGLGPGVGPFGPAGAGAVGLPFDSITGASRASLRCGHGRGHDVGTVGVVGDLAEALRLALRAVHAARHVEPFERGVGLGRDLDLGLPEEGRVGDGAGEALGGDLGGDGRPVDPGGDELQVLAVEAEGAVGRLRVRAEGDAGEDAGGRGMQAEGEFNALHEPGGGRVVGKVDCGGACVLHGSSVRFEWASYGPPVRSASGRARVLCGPSTALACLHDSSCRLPG